MLTLRGEGRTYAEIASRLGLKRSKDAYEAFHRALNSSLEAEKPELIRQEQGRLDVLETRIRSRDAAEPEKMDRRLRALAQMRERLTAPRDRS